ncbi:MAG TPA: N-acetyltransferase [Anaerolineae bacterium]|nr:N-acetyltransferase [Anaerolineae bacterium]
MLIRPEQIEDATAVSHINTAAFGRPDEARLVERLRCAGVEMISLVAVVDTAVVGHILFTPVTVESDEQYFAAMALGPVGVLPEWQKQGVGAALIEAGLQACGEAGHKTVFVLGHSDYYPRFGFEPTRPYGIACEYDVPNEAFMVVELEAGALANVTGIVHYRPEFNEV